MMTKTGTQSDSLSSRIAHFRRGEMGEWLKPDASKASVPQKGTGGSNPSLSAIILRSLDFARDFGNGLRRPLNASSSNPSLRQIFLSICRAQATNSVFALEPSRCDFD